MLGKIVNKKVFNIVSITIEWIISILLIILIILTAFQRFSNQGNFFGYRIYTVASGSMIPTYNIGDTLLIKETDVSELEVGDAVTYIGDTDGVDGLIITHAIQKIEKGEDDKFYFHTKGIANNIEDPIVSEDQVLGKVVHRFIILSIFGKITTNMTSLLLFITFPVALLIAIEIIKLVYKQEDDEYAIEDFDKEAFYNNMYKNDPKKDKKISDFVDPDHILEVMTPSLSKDKKKKYQEMAKRNKKLARKLARKNAYYNKQRIKKRNEKLALLEKNDDSEKNKVELIDKNDIINKSSDVSK